MTLDITLPPLPRGDVYVRGSVTGQPMWAFNEQQMLDFAKQAVLADREQRGEPMAWRDTVDDMLTVCHEVASDDPRESINRLINWHVSVALDPAVSSDAAALVQSGREQRGEPVAWMYTSRLGNSYVTNRQADPDADWRETPLYASPQPVEQRKPLTDEQITAMHRKLDPDCHISFTFRIARAIEAHHGITGDKAWPTNP